MEISSGGPIAEAFAESKRTPLLLKEKCPKKILKTHNPYLGVNMPEPHCNVSISNRLKKWSRAIPLITVLIASPAYFDGHTRTNSDSEMNPVRPTVTININLIKMR